MPRWLLALAIVVAPAVAAAEGDLPHYYPRATVGPGIGMFIADIGALDATGPSLQLAADVRITRVLQLRAMVEHAFLFATAGDELQPREIRANLDGAALLLHHPIFAFPAPSDFRCSGDMHVIAGAEYTRIAWEHMPAFGRVNGVFGFGGTLVVHDQATKRIASQQIDFGLRVLVGRAPEPAMSPWVSESRTLPFDRSLVLEIAWRYAL